MSAPVDAIDMVEDFDYYTVRALAAGIEESRARAHLRDLVPELLSGGIRFPQAENAVEAAL